MPSKLVDTLLQTLAGAEDHERAWGLLNQMQRGLLQVPEIGAELAARAARAEPDGDEPVEHLALESLLTGARMDRENGRKDGVAFLAAVEGAVQRLADNGELPLAGAIAVGGCYVRAGLTPPTALSDGGWMEAAVVESAPTEMPDIQALLDGLRNDAGGDAYALHAELSNTLATFPPAMGQLIIAEVLARAERLYDQIGGYWLLDPALHVRRAAAEGFLQRVRAGTLDAAVASRLIGVRAWIPVDAARDALDATIKAAMRQEVTGGNEAKPWKLHRIFASIPDGVGAQSIVIGAQSSVGSRVVAMLLLKQNFGIKDAFVIRCESASEQKRCLAGVTDQLETCAISPEYLAFALADALADGVAIGAPPAHGFFDVSTICGLEGLRPARKDIGDWVSYCDPEGSLAQLSPQKLGRIVNESADYAEEFEIAQSWYEDSAEIEDLMNGAITPNSREKAMWRHLETRRGWWELIFAKTAATLKTEGSENVSQAFAATALAIRKGRPLPKVQLARMIFERSLERADGPLLQGFLSALGRTQDQDLGENVIRLPSSEAPIGFEMIAQEKRGEFQRILKSTGADVTAHWFDGYLASLVAAPKMVHPEEWVDDLLEQAGDFKTEAQMDRFIDLVMLRYNAANQEIADAKANRSRLANLNDDAFRHWALGFHTGVVSYKREWRGRSLKKDDKAILSLFADVALDRSDADELKKLTPAWLAQRLALRD